MTDLAKKINDLIADVKSTNNTAVQSGKVKTFLKENKRWGFTCEQLKTLFSSHGNDAVNQSWVDDMAETAVVVNVYALVTAMEATDNGSVRSQMCDDWFPFMVAIDHKRQEGAQAHDVNDAVQEQVIKMYSNSATAMLVGNKWKSDGSKKLYKDKDLPNAEDYAVLLGGYDIVSKDLAILHAALRKVGTCRAGYGWQPGHYNDPCDTCKQKTEEGYNCKGGGHFVCGRCVQKAIDGVSVSASQQQEQKKDLGPLLPKDQVVTLLNALNARAAEQTSLQEIGRVSDEEGKKVGISDFDNFKRSAEEYGKADKSIADAYQQYGSVVMKAMSSGGAGGGLSVGGGMAMGGGMGFGMSVGQGQGGQMNVSVEVPAVSGQVSIGMPGQDNIAMTMPGQANVQMTMTGDATMDAAMAVNQAAANAIINNAAANVNVNANVGINANVNMNANITADMPSPPGFDATGADTKAASIPTLGDANIPKDKCWEIVKAGLALEPFSLSGFNGILSQHGVNDPDFQASAKKHAEADPAFAEEFSKLQMKAMSAICPCCSIM